ncbi:NnrS protein involved in response to NO [Paramagnetospirillum magnetotacticum MS-1]|uniref:NnrS protein involved in response to NO n=1 Tax=Paramagnetospirillum magnetotacticum MS-1 TaxID=272627 RepID=A0A0C2YUH6_PARME|nr:NnrS family protein [Paramagnetospirillum magnetotacticum]KIL98778.1 NnrS protein involved in response to NO [Paramagnetospirillum magnetotacticum MS-1]
MATIPLMEPVYKGSRGPVFFAAGFRPFFLFAAIQAAVMLPVWLLAFAGILPVPANWNPVVWHSHAMVFGLGGAAVGGFLLTAVPNWTNSHHVSGRPLMALFGLWLAGRAAVALAGILPPLLVAAIDLGYLPLLAYLLAKPLIQAGKWRNIVFLPILGVLWLAGMCAHIEALTGHVAGLKGVTLGIFILLLMIAIVGGRIIPSFTQNWLRMQGRPVDVAPVGWIESGGAGGIVALAGLAQVLLPSSPLAGGTLLLAALVHAWRLSGWHGLKVVSSPILVILHVGYAWMVLGFALLGLSAFIASLPPSAALHALTAGAIATMIMAVMSRAALGHAGHPLVVSKLTVWAYGLISAGALLRVVAPVIPDGMMVLTMMGGGVWTLAWLLYVVVYFPICTRPRADGRPG